MAEIIGTAGDDVITAGDEWNRIYASGGIDSVIGGMAGDQLFFGFGNVLSPGITVSNADRTILFGASNVSDSAGQFTTSYSGIEQLFLAISDYSGTDAGTNLTIDASLQTAAFVIYVSGFGLGSNLHYIGSQGTDYLTLDAQDHVLDGGEGSDLLQFAAPDILIGGSGLSLTLASGGKVSSVTSIEQIEIYAQGNLVDASAANTDILNFYVQTADIIGSAGSDTFHFQYVDYYTSDMFIVGGPGADRYLFGGGVIKPNLAFVQIADFAVPDTLDFSTVGFFGNPIAFIGTDPFTGTANQLRYEISGNNTVVYMDIDGDGVADGHVTIANGAFDLEETFTGSAILQIDDGLNQITGTPGADDLNTTAGTDVVNADAGNDYIFGSRGSDIVDGGSGQDVLLFHFPEPASGLTADFANRTITVTAEAISDSAGQIQTSFTGIERIFITGSGFSTGTSIFDLSGFVGAEVFVASVFSSDVLIVTGSSGADSISVEMGAHDLDGGAGSDRLQILLETSAIATEVGGELRVAADGATVRARNFETVVFDLATALGSVNASSLTRPIEFSLSNGVTAIGGSGNDLFDNNIGEDNPFGLSFLTGGGGADTYRYGPLGANIDGDHITDFATEDRIDLLAGSFYQSNPIQFIGTNAFTGVTNQVRYVKVGATTQLLTDEDGDAVADSTLYIDNGAFDLEETFAGSGVLRIKAAPFGATAGDDIINGTPGNDIIDGLGGNDTINGLAGIDHLIGGDGNDQLNGGLGVDILDGGAGNDRLVVDAIGGPVAGESFLGGDGIDTLVLGSLSLAIPSGSFIFTSATLSSIERVEFGTTAGTSKTLSMLYNHVGSGIAANAELVGGAGRDQITLTSVGNATVTVPDFVLIGMDPAFDVLSLGAPDNFSHTINARDNFAMTQQLIGGSASDTLNGSNGNDILLYGSGDILRGNDGNDVLRFTQVSTGFPPNFSQTTFYTGGLAAGGDGIDRLLVFGDVDIRGLVLTQVETITLQRPTASVNGVPISFNAFLRTDTSVLGIAPTYFIEGEGQIILNLAGNQFDGSQLTFASNAIGFDIYGSSADDTIIGSSTGNILDGGLGKDKLIGGAGDDIVRGGDGADQLNGGAGEDALTGGSGGDRFIFDQAILNDGLAVYDTITDFNRSEDDRINLASIDANINNGGVQKFTFIGAATFSGKAGQLRYEAAGSDTALLGDVNGDGLADFQIIVTGSHALVGSDFML